MHRSGQPIIGKSVYTQTNKYIYYRWAIKLRIGLPLRKDKPARIIIKFTKSLTRKKKNKKIAAKKTAGIGFLQQPIETVDALGYFL